MNAHIPRPRSGDHRLVLPARREDGDPRAVAKLVFLPDRVVDGEVERDPQRKRLERIARGIARNELLTGAQPSPEVRDTLLELAGRIHTAPEDVTIDGRTANTIRTEFGAFVQRVRGSQDAVVAGQERAVSPGDIAALKLTLDQLEQSMSPGELSRS